MKLLYGVSFETKPPLDFEEDLTLTLQVLSVDSFWEVYIKIWFGQVVEDPLENNFWC